MPKLSRRRVLLWALVAIFLVWDVSNLIDRSKTTGNRGIDFLGYWASGQVFYEGGNPYDPTALFPVEKSIGFGNPEAMVGWAPPWVHLILFPFEILPFQLSKAIWFIFNLIILMWIATTFRMSERADDLPWISCLTVLFFIPCAISLYGGSASPLVLAGLVGFVWCIRKQSDLLAGCSLLLLSLKPHVIYLFWPFLLLWVARTRRWRVLICLSGTLFLFFVVTSFTNPGIYSLYLRGLFSDHGPRAWETPTIYMVLRKLFPNCGSELQYLLIACGLWFSLSLWRKWQNDLNWQQMAVSLTVFSTLTAPYVWPGDFVVLLPVTLLVLQRYRLRQPFHQYLVLALFLMQVVIVMQMYTAKSYFVMAWVAPALGLIWIFSERTTRSFKRA